MYKVPLFTFKFPDYIIYNSAETEAIIFDPRKCNVKGKQKRDASKERKLKLRNIRNISS